MKETDNNTDRGSYILRKKTVYLMIYLGLLSLSLLNAFSKADHFESMSRCSLKELPAKLVLNIAISQSPSLKKDY